jgi:23S rRNA (guanosine2251-2'-O)-methyltransferase
MKSVDDTAEVVYGIHAVMAALRTGPTDVNEIWLLNHDGKNKRLAEINSLALKTHIPVRYVARNELDEYSNNARHQGVMARLKQKSALTETDLAGFLAGLEQPPFLLVLDGIQDPHNLGACIRTANAAGMHAVIAPRDRASGITPVVRKVASGAVEAIPFIPVTNLARVLRRLKELGVWVVGADENAVTTLFDADLTGPIAVVLGAEGKGLRRLTREHCDLVVKIPMAGLVESLNVSVAAGVCIYEVMRQRMKS